MNIRNSSIMGDKYRLQMNILPRILDNKSKLIGVPALVSP